MITCDDVGWRAEQELMELLKKPELQDYGEQDHSSVASAEDIVAAG